MIQRIPDLSHLPGAGFDFNAFKTANPPWSQEIYPFAILLSDVLSEEAITEVSLRNKRTGEIEMTKKLFLPLYSPVCIGEDALGMTALTLWKETASFFMKRLRSDFNARKDPPMLVYLFNFTVRDPSWVLWNISDYDEYINKTKSVIKTIRKVLFRTFAAENELPKLFNWEHLSKKTIFCMKDENDDLCLIDDMLKWIPVKTEGDFSKSSHVLTSPEATTSPFKKAKEDDPLRP